MLFKAPTPGDFQSADISSFVTPPPECSYEPSNERREAILNVAKVHGLTLFKSRQLEAATRRFEAATGTAVSYFTGGTEAGSGFTPKAHPELTSPFQWTPSSS